MANTMRQAFHSWQELNARLQKAWEELNYHYLALFDKAQICQIDTGQGLLRTASATLRRPLDPQTLQLKMRLTNAFAFLGKSFCRRSPSSLKLDMYHYADCIEEICRQFKRLGTKLRLAREVLDFLQHNKPSARHYCDSALFDPEAVWATLLLQQRHRLSRQNLDLSRQHSWQAKISACQSWLKVLQISLSPENVVELRQGLEDLHALCRSTAAGPYAENALRQLDFCTDIAHRLSQQPVFSPPDETN